MHNSNVAEVNSLQTAIYIKFGSSAENVSLYFLGLHDLHGGVSYFAFDCVPVCVSVCVCVR